MAQQILSILGSHIDIEHIFFVVGVLISLQQCHLGVENLNNLVMIYKNWLVDVQVNYKLVVGDRLGEFFVAKETLLEENEELLEKEHYFEKT